MSRNVKPQITLFHCINTFADSVSIPLPAGDDLELKTVKMACSSMVKDVFLLRAFESGSDAVVVMVCPEGQCDLISIPERSILFGFKKKDFVSAFLICDNVRIEWTG